MSGLFGTRRHLACIATVFAFLALGASGCGDDISSAVSCNTFTDCPRPLGGEVPGERLDVECCAGTCVVVAIGCDSGYRFVTSEPEVGSCVAAPLCDSQMDMSVAEDLSSSDEDSGA